MFIEYIQAGSCILLSKHSIDHKVKMLVPVLSRRRLLWRAAATDGEPHRRNTQGSVQGQTDVFIRIMLGGVLASAARARRQSLIVAVRIRHFFVAGQFFKNDLFQVLLDWPLERLR